MTAWGLLEEELERCYRDDVQAESENVFLGSGYQPLFAEYTYCTLSRARNISRSSLIPAGNWQLMRIENLFKESEWSDRKEEGKWKEEERWKTGQCQFIKLFFRQVKPEPQCAQSTTEYL